MITPMSRANVSLREWNIIIITHRDGKVTEHFVGFSVDDGLGRLSTPIANYDEKSYEGRTESGSIYSTMGEPGRPHADALYVLESQLHYLVEITKLYSKNLDFLSFKYPFEAQDKLWAGEFNNNAAD